MNPSSPSYKYDFVLHAIVLAVQIAALIPGGILQNGVTPPFIYPCLLILAAVTLYRQDEVSRSYQTRLILIPSILSCLLYGFCLINEMTRDLWAFAQVRQFPVIVRIFWYQTGLFLIHPQVFPRLTAGLSRLHKTLRSRGYYGAKIWVIAFIAFCLMWMLRSQNISPDGYDWLKHSTYPKHWVRYLREPFGTFLFFLFVQLGMKIFHWAPYISITVLGISCGIISTIILWRVFRYAIGETFSAASILLLFASYGYTQIFVGNIEIYALLHLGLSVFLYSVVRFLEDEWPAWAAGLAFGVLFGLHLSAGWWLPALLTVPWLKQRVTKKQRPFFLEYLHLSIGFALFWIPFSLFVWMYGYNGDFTVLWNHFWSDQVMNVGADGTMFRPLEALITFNVYLAMLNEYSCMAAGGIMLAVVIAASRPGWKICTPFCAWTGLLTFLYFIYSIVWNPDRHFPADWDIFSGMTIPAILLISQLASRLHLRREAILYLFYQSIVFSGLYLFIQILRNHIKTTEWPLL